MREPFNPDPRCCALRACGEKFTPIRRGQRFCKPEHRHAWHNQRLARAYKLFAKQGA